MDCKNILQKAHTIYHSNPLSGVCHISLLLLIYIEMWSGLEAFWRTSKKEGKKPFEQRLNDSFCCFCSNWITSWYNFLSAFFLPNNKIKINNYPLSLKVQKGFGLIKVVIHFSFFLTKSSTAQEFKYFSWNFRIIKNLKTG